MSADDEVSLQLSPSDETAVNSQVAYTGIEDSPLLYQQMPNSLARYCPHLTSLSVSDFNVFSWSTAKAFANAIPFLPQLKELDVRGNVNFTNTALKNLCRNCPYLESLKIDDRPGDRLSLHALKHIGGLKNLKVLEIVRRCSHPVDDNFIAQLCAGSGATLEQVRFRSKLVTDASLGLLVIKCGNLATLDFAECPKFTLAGLCCFVREISNDPSWTDPTKNRRLHITVGLPSRFQIDIDNINQLTDHPGRLVITNIKPEPVSSDDWDDRRCDCVYSGESDTDEDEDSDNSDDDD